jgi:hypothetical protein
MWREEDYKEKRKIKSGDLLLAFESNVGQLGHRWRRVCIFNTGYTGY